MNNCINVSLVTFQHTIEEIKPTIESVLNSELIHTLYIIDNSPTSALRASVETYEQVKYIFNNGNIGFGAGHNISIRHTIEEGISFHIIINPDVWFENNTIETLFEYISIHKEVGLIAPKILYPDGTLQYHCKLLPTPWDWFVRGFGSKHMKEQLNRKFELHNFGYDKPANIPYLNGSFMLFRIEALQKVGLFDEHYFMYSEDCDITRSIHEQYQTLFFPKAVITHAFNRESHRNKALFRIQIQSTIHYFNKWGWLFDRSRRAINKSVLKELGLS